MSRPVIVSFLWPKNYPVLLELAKTGGVDIAAPVNLVPGAMAAELAKYGARLIPLISSNYIRYAAAAMPEADRRYERIRAVLPQLLGTPSAASPESTGTSVAILEESLPPLLKDSMALIDELDELLENEHVAAILLNETDLPIGRLAAHWARERGVKSFLVSHGGNIGSAYTVTRCMLADYLFVFGTRGMETYLDIGIPADRMIVTGNPSWDHYPQVLADRAKYRETAYANMNLRTSEPLVLFATLWNTKLTATLEANAFEKTVRAFFRGCKRLRDAGVGFNAVIKDRPSNSEFGKNEARRIANEEGFPDYKYGIGDMEAYIVAADLLVSHDSNVFVEAMIAGVPAINLWTPSSWLLGPGFDVNDGIPMIQSSNDAALAEVMQAILTDAAFRATVVSQMARALPRFHAALDGQATARCAAAVLERLPADSFKAASNGHVTSGVALGVRKLLKLMAPDARSIVVAGTPAETLAELSRTHPLTTVQTINVSHSQTIELDEVRPGADHIDCVILTTVLAEVRDPLGFLSALKTRLSPRGQVLASIPNVRNLWLISELMAGRWNRADGDLLDFGRIRFFTLQSIMELFGEAGYKIDRVEQIDDPRIPEIVVPPAGTMNIDTEALTLKTLPATDVAELRALEFLICARPMEA